MFFFLFLNKNIMLTYFFLKMNYLNFYFVFYFDKFNILFFFILMLIFFLIFIYSMYYMNSYFFNWLMLLFVLIMIFLIFSLNLFSLIMWWDLLGLVSFLLVLFFKSNKIINFSLIVMILNRFSDFMMLISLVLFIKDLNLNLILNVENKFCLMFLFSLMLKSAQFPFNLWLPLAMVAPMPVSALVHSSTLVIVGLYFLFRCSSLISLEVLFYFSFLTLFFFGYNLIISLDFKKIMAFSTMNHMSLMMLFIYMKMNNFMFIYMLIHALFKSMIFMCIGVMIYFNFDIQDIRKLNYINLYLPFFFFFFLVKLIMMGMFYMSFFYFKDLFMEFFFMNNLNNFFFFFFFFLVYFMM